MTRAVGALLKEEEVSDMHYRVSWEIDIEAGTPEKAARQALAIQRDAQSTARVFEVRLDGPCPSCRQHVVHKDTCRVGKRTGIRRINQPQTIDLTGGS
jgi:hypothetical protein